MFFLAHSSSRLDLEGGRSWKRAVHAGVSLAVSKQGPRDYVYFHYRGPYMAVSRDKGTPILTLNTIILLMGTSN